MTEDPLILSGSAARRLKLLLGHGVELTPGLRGVCERLAGSGLALAEGGAAGGGRNVLRAALLPRPVHWDEGAAAGGDADRDVHGELAASLATLKAFKLSSGTLVEVRPAARPDAPAHLARIMADTSAPDGVALLAPSLAYNLGLSLHLWPLLHPAAAAAAEAAAGAPAPPASSESVTISKYNGPDVAAENGASAEQQQQQQQQPPPQWADLCQPASDAVRVAVAEEVHLSVVRIPAPALLAADEGSGEGEEGQSPLGPMSSAARDAAAAAEADAVAAIQGHFVGGLRLVCQGDVLAVRKSGFDKRAEVLGHLLEPAAGAAAPAAPAAPPLLYFRVAQVLPEGGGARGVDVARTVVRLSGSCSSGLPVGLPGYLGYLGPAALPAASLGLLGVHPAAAAAPGALRLEHAGALLPAWRQLAELLVPVIHPAAAHLPLRVAALLHGPPGGGKLTAVAAAAAALGVHVVSISCHDLKNNATSERAVLDGLGAAFVAAAHYRPALLVLRHFQIFTEGAHGGGESAAARAGAALAECIQRGFEQAADRDGGPAGPFPAPVVLLACAPSVEDVAAPLRRCFTHELAVAAPEQGARELLLRSFMGGAGDGLSAEAWGDLARHTAGLLPRDLRSLAADACGAAALQTLAPAEVADAAQAAAPTNGGAHPPPAAAPLRLPQLLPDHISAALDRARQRSAEDIGAPKIPNVRWEDVGGLEDVKRAILDTVELPLKHPELFAGGLRRRSGVLLYGPPGTGKTLLAKAVATECAVNFMSVKGPELINMYVGESERQIREVFARARRARPCVVFFDELDSLAPARGRGSDSGGVMDRVVSQLLAEIDGAQGGGGGDDVFVVGATNRPDLLDAALLRPGRLDRLLYVGVAADPAAQLSVLRALTRRFQLHADVDLGELSVRCPPRLTGADLYALCSDAWMTALKRVIAEREAQAQAGGGAAGQGSGAGQGGGRRDDVVVRHADFVAALHDLRPSLSEADVARYEAVRDQYMAR